jgi:hypothetical protein
MHHRVVAQRAAETLASVLRERELWRGNRPGKHEGGEQISWLQHIPAPTNRPKLLATMKIHCKEAYRRVP